MKPRASFPHILLSLLLPLGLLLGAFGPTLVKALGTQIDLLRAATPSSIKRQDPVTDPTNAGTLTFRVTFSAAVSDVGLEDFILYNNSPAPTTSAPLMTINAVSPSIYDISLWGGDLDSFNGTVGLDFSPGAEIRDTDLNLIATPEPAIDEFFTVDNTSPTVTISPSAGQADPATTQPIQFDVTFSEEMNTATLEQEDILQGGTANIYQSIITDLGDHQHFRLTVMVTENGVILPSIFVNSVFDLAGNGNLGFSGGCGEPEPNNCITLIDDLPLEVSIERHALQPHPTYSLPVRFTVTFSEPIRAGDFTVDDISQLGTSGKLLWTLTDAGNNREFTLTAEDATYGTLIPVILADRVRDLVGNWNRGSTGTNGTVLYIPVPTVVPTATPSQVPPHSVVINEVAWMGTAASVNDEWIELRNTTGAPVSMNGWRLRSYRWIGTVSSGHWTVNLNVTFAAGDVIPAGGYYLLERGDEDTVWDIPANKIYSDYLLNDTGEVLLLCSRQNMSAGVCSVENKHLLVDYANASWFGNGSNNTFPAGKGAPLFGTMERQDPFSDADSNWFTHPNAAPKYGFDRNGIRRLNGTPAHPNWALNVTATPTYLPPTSTYTVTSIGAYDGWILESGEDSGKGEALNTSAATIKLGDDPLDKQYRAILHFKTAGLPNNALITKATLRIQVSEGTLPFGIFGNIKVDMRVPYFGANYALRPGDFEEAAGFRTVAAFTSLRADDTSIAVLSPTARSYISLTGTTEFRLYFGLGDNDDLTADNLSFYSGNAPVASLYPVLIIEYTVP